VKDEIGIKKLIGSTGKLLGCKKKPRL